MRIFTLTIWLALSMATVSAIAAQDIRAVTEDGRKVLLSANGKWRFSTEKTPAPSLPLDLASPYQPGFKKAVFTFNMKDWVLTPKRDKDGYNKRIFEHKTLPVTGMIIADEIPAATDMMKNLILENARTGGSDIMVLVDETRPLGNKETGFIQFTANVNGIEFMFMNQYYADQDGNIQVFCFTGQALFAKYQDICKQFLSGLTIH